MAQEKLPAMPVYIGDWDKDPLVKMMTAEDEGIYFRIVKIMWESDRRGYLVLNGSKIETNELATMIRLDNQRLSEWLTRYQTTKKIFGETDDAILFSRKHVKMVALSEKRKNSGKLGGNPILLKQDDNQNYSQSYPDSKSNAENEIENEYELGNASLKENKDELFYKFWRAYPKRSDRKKARAVWDKLKPAPDEAFVEKVCAAIAAQAKDRAAREAAGKFAPEWKNPTTWLRGECWNDEIQPIESGLAAGQGVSSQLGLERYQKVSLVRAKL